VKQTLSDGSISELAQGVISYKEQWNHPSLKCHKSLSSCSL